MTQERNSQPIILYDESNNPCNLTNNALNVNVQNSISTGPSTSVTKEYPYLVYNPTFNDLGAVDTEQVFYIENPAVGGSTALAITDIQTLTVNMTGIGELQVDTLKKFNFTDSIIIWTLTPINVTFTPVPTLSDTSFIELQFKSESWLTDPDTPEMMIYTRIYANNDREIGIRGNLIADPPPVIPANFNINQNILNNDLNVPIRIYMKISIDKKTIGEIYQGEMHDWHTYYLDEMAPNLGHCVNGRLGFHVNTDAIPSALWSVHYHNLQIFDKCVNSRPLEWFTDLLISGSTVNFNSAHTTDAIYIATRDGTIINKIVIQLKADTPATSWPGSTYGPTSALSNGILLFTRKRLTTEYIYNTDQPIKCTNDYLRFSSSNAGRSAGISIGLDDISADGYCAVIDFGPNGVLLDLNDRIGLRLDDTFSGLDTHLFQIHGSRPL